MPGKSAHAALDRRPAHVLVAALACALLAALVLDTRLSPVTPVAAGPDPDERPSPRRVSTSPDEKAAAPTPPPAHPSAGDPERSTALTRAAERRRIETISPVPWLARFGPVSLERRE